RPHNRAQGPTWEEGLWSAPPSPERRAGRTVRGRDITRGGDRVGAAHGWSAGQRTAIWCLMCVPVLTCSGWPAGSGGADRGWLSLPVAEGRPVREDCGNEEGPDARGLEVCGGPAAYTIGPS